MAGSHGEAEIWRTIWIHKSQSFLMVRTVLCYVSCIFSMFYDPVVPYHTNRYSTSFICTLGFPSNLKLMIKRIIAYIPSPDIGCLDLDGIETIIAIQSNPMERRRRDDSRKTWIHHQKNHLPTIKAIFVFGTPENSNETYDPVPEINEHCDIVQVNFVDSYANVTMDTMAAMRFVLSWPGLLRTLKHLVTADDDVYINSERLRKLLTSKKWPQVVQCII